MDPEIGHYQLSNSKEIFYACKSCINQPYQKTIFNFLLGVLKNVCSPKNQNKIQEKRVQLCNIFIEYICYHSHKGFKVFCFWQMSNFFEGIPSTFLQACLSITCECDFHFKLKLFKYGTLNFHPKKVIQNYSNLIKKVLTNVTF